LPPTIDNGGKLQINEKDLWQTADHQEKPVCMFLPASPVGELIGGESGWLTVTGAADSQIFLSKEQIICN
jgi:hypothetical protein